MVEECRELLDLYRDRSRASADVKILAKRRIEDIEHKIAELQGMQASLEYLIDKCHGDDRPDCPILDDLSGQGMRLNEFSSHLRAPLRKRQVSDRPNRLSTITRQSGMASLDGRMDVQS